MYRKSLLLFGLLILLSSCNAPIGGDKFFGQVQELESHIKNEEWEKSEDKLIELNNYIKDHFWKLQLLGDEEEYEGIRESIRKLSVAINNKEKTDSLIEIATLITYLEAIYSL